MLFAGGSKSGPVFLYRVLIHGVCVYIYIAILLICNKGKTSYFLFFFFYLPNYLVSLPIYFLFCFVLFLHFGPVVFELV